MRRRNSFLNILTGIGSQIILIFLGFISRKVFVNIMGLQVLGINGLFSNIISMLSLADLGIGGAIYYSLYKPLANNDKTEIRAIMQLYAKLYRYIALAVAVIGISLLPFLGIIIKENVDYGYLRSVYLIFLADSVLSYLFAYKKNIISADQKSYIIIIIQTCFAIALQIIQITVISLTHNFVLYLLIKVMLGFSSNLLFYFLTDKRYPYLKSKDKAKLKPETKAEIIKNAKALFVVNISIYCVFGTDNILISTFVNVAAVGLYSNYCLIVNTVNTLSGQIFAGIRASFGNFLVKESIEDAHKLFNVIYFVNFWITGFCSVCLIVLLNPLINIWLGKESLFPLSAVVLIVINFYIRGMTTAVEVVRNCAGLYSPYPFFKYWDLVEGILNLAAGIILSGVLKMGIMGIFLATTISTQLTVGILPWHVYKYVFKSSSKIYFKKYLIYLATTVLFTSITFGLCSIGFVDNEILAFIIKGVICLIVPNVIVMGLYSKTKEFKFIWDMRRNVVNKVRNRIRIDNQ